MHRLIAWWVHNPVAANLLMVGILLAGVLGFFAMEREVFPNIKPKQVQVEVIWPGAAPQEVEEQVVARIEEALKDIYRRLRPGDPPTLKSSDALFSSLFFNEERYDKLLVARPIMPLGRDIGYLPGDKDEKLTAWMQPLFDNLTYLLSTRGAQNQSPESHTSEQRIEKLMTDGRLVLRPIEQSDVDGFPSTALGAFY